MVGLSTTGSRKDTLSLNMVILLTNDDGYQAEGLNVLEEVLSSAGHETWVCAPSDQRSAQSHAMTLRGNVRIVRYGQRHYHCSGTPADCILYGLSGGTIGVRPDLVVSGINHGYNASTDILYSGTVGAAREAILRGVPGIAISARIDHESGRYPFKEAAGFLASHLEEFLPLCTSDTLLNINVPPHDSGRWRVGRVGVLEYFDAVEKVTSSKTTMFDASSTKLGLAYGTETDSDMHIGGEMLLALAEGKLPGIVDDGQITDYVILSEGDVCVTPLQVLPAINERAFAAMEAMQRGCP